MSGPHVHVPYHLIGEYLPYIIENRVNLEVYFSASSLDSIQASDVSGLTKRLGYFPSFTIHAPFMDLSPGAVDSRVREITVERFTHVFDIAQILKPKAIVFHSGYEKWKYAMKVDVWLEKSLLTWKPLLYRAIDTDTKIAIENIFEDEPSNLRLLMEEIGSERFGVCFDAGHFNLFSKGPLEEWMAQLRPYIVELHLHDNRGSFDDHIAVGDGTFDFEKLFFLLKGRDLIYTIEGHTPGDVFKSIARLKEYQKRIPGNY